MRSLNLTHQVTRTPLWTETPLIDSDFKSKPMFTTDEWFDKLCKRVGEKFGMNDIREGQVYVHRVIPQSLVIY